MANRDLTPPPDRNLSAGPLTPAALHILLALADQDRHGLGIAENIEAFTGGRIALGPGTLYGAIKRLLDSGLIEDTAARPKGDTDDPRRRYYRLTRRGRRAIEAEARGLAAVLGVARIKGVL